MDGKPRKQFQDDSSQTTRIKGTLFPSNQYDSPARNSLLSEQLKTTSTMMTQYFLSNRNGEIPHSTIVSDDPHLLAFHAMADVDPTPFIICHDPVNPSFINETLTTEEVNQFITSLEEMKQPVLFDIMHGWRVFRSSLDSEEGLWMYDLSGRKPLELTQRRNVGMTFKSGWITDV